MKLLNYSTLMLSIFCATPCFAQDATLFSGKGDRNTASVEALGDQTVATIHGKAGIAIVQGDKVELSRGAVYVNGRSYGAVPDSCEIKYIITKTGRSLFVDGKERALPAK